MREGGKRRRGALKTEGMSSADRIIPAPISDEMTARVQELARRTFEVLGCTGVARVDLLLDAQDRLFVNEPNTIPGSFAFYLWEPVGLPFTDLLDELIDIAMAEHAEKQQTTRTFETNLLAMRGEGGKRGGGREATRRVAVAKGGTSIEREVSLRGARRVTAALRQAGDEVTEVEIDHTVLDRVREVAPAFVFIVAHGRNGEDGSLQALLELLGVPYTGSDSLASALCMDKILTKRLLQRAGLPTPPFHAFSRRTFQDLGAATVFDDVMGSLGAPVVVKPARMGSSFGIKFVSHPDQLRTAVLGSVAYDDEILVEQHVAGRELAVTVLGGARPRPPAAAAGVADRRDLLHP